MATRPVTYVEFCDRVGITLEAGQLPHALVAFDGVQVADLPLEQQATARELFGEEIGAITAEQRRVVVDVTGGRGGKTFRGSTRGLHLALTVDLSALAPGQEAKVWFIAPDKGLGTEALNYVRGLLHKFPNLKRLIRVENTERIVIERTDGKLVAFEIKAASRMGTATRGRVIIFAMLDEAAFFRDSDHAVNDAQIFEAVAPRVMMGGQIYIPSTPWAEAGLLYEMFAANWGHPVKALAAHAPTLLMRSDPLIRQQVADAYERDHDNADREFGARFLSAGTVSWLDPAQVDAAVKRWVANHGSLEALPVLPPPGAYVAVAGDLGMNRNSSASAAAHRPCNPATGEAGLRVVIADLLEMRPTAEEPLRPSHVCGEIVVMVQRHGASALVADQHYKETMREALGLAELYLRDAPHDTTEPWVTFRNLCRGGLVDLPPDPVLISQLKAIRWKALSGGRVSIILPKTKDGRHGDVAQVVALAANDVWTRPSDQAAREVAEHGTVERDQQRDLDRLDEWAARRQREREEAAMTDDWTVAV